MGDADENDPLGGEVENAASHTRRAFFSHVGLLGTAVALWPFDVATGHEAENPASGLMPKLNSSTNDPTSGNDNMPLVRFDAFDGRSDAEVKTLLDAAHKAIVGSFRFRCNNIR